MMKKGIVLASCLIAVAVSLAACNLKTNNNDTTLRIAWWGGEPRHNSTISVIDMYKAANPGINIETEYTSWDGYWDKLTSQMAARNLPDVIQQDYAYFGQWIDDNQLADLTEFVDNGTIDLTNVGENFIGGNVDGGIYGISLGTNALSLVYNPEAYIKAGLELPNENYTWSQFISDTAKIKTVGFDTPLLVPNDPKFMVEQMVRENGMSFYNADGTALGFEDAMIVENALRMQADFVNQGLSVDKDVAYSISVQNAEDSLVLKRIVWSDIAWSNQFVPLAKLVEEACFDINLNVMPKLDGADKSGVYLKPSMLFSVSSMSENKEEAAKFINYFINDVEANKVLAGERGVPVSSVIRDSLKDTLSNPEKKVYDYIDLVGRVGSPIDRPEPAGSGEVSAVLKTIFQEVVYGAKSPEEGAAEFMKTANDILAKNKE